MNFSSENRKKITDQLNHSSFDILVIGGGITGAGIALDAASRGLKVALVEMQDFAAGTSSRSTKLIHGGLRYLKQLEFKLVAQVGKEREIIHQNAPHLTKPEPMLLPIIQNGSLNKFSARIGMRIYEWLAGVKKEELHKVFSAEDTIEAEPLLRKDNLKGGILFYEYRTDDARLTIEVLKEAVERGAVALNYMKAISFVYTNKTITGAKVVDQLKEELYLINAKCIVNAGGPWVDDLDNLDKKEMEHKLHITKGVHLVVDWKKLPITQSLYFDSFDNRMIFAIKREHKTYIGTTDTFYEGDIKNPTITEEDINYLLKCANAYFPNNKLNLSDIESGWAGLRPLINKPGKGPSEISRKDEMFESESGLLTIAGGKLTGYRKMAERVVNRVTEKLYKQNSKRFPECSTQHISISGGKLNGAKSFAGFVKDKTLKGVAIGLTTKEAETLCYRYGSNVDELYKLVEHLKTEKNELPLIMRAQIRYAIHSEMCVNPSDFFIRRTGYIYFNIESVIKWKEAVFAYMQAILSWKSELANTFYLDLKKAIEQVENLKREIA